MIACRILFSFKVCSTCFNFTTLKFEANHQNYTLFKSRWLIYHNTCYITRFVPKSNAFIHLERPTFANTAHQECSNFMLGTRCTKKQARRFYASAFAVLVRDARIFKLTFANKSTNRLLFTTYTVHFTLFWNSWAKEIIDQKIKQL